jgi:hypothetical protein
MVSPKPCPSKCSWSSSTRARASWVATLSKQEAATGESASATISTLSKDGVAKLVAHAGCKTIDHPNLVALQLDPFSVHMGSEVSYVAGIEQVAIEGVGHIADPVVKTVKEGTLVEGRALVARASDRPDVPPLFAARIEVQ